MADVLDLYPRSPGAIEARREDPSSRTVDVLRDTAEDPPSDLESLMDNVEGFLRNLDAVVHRTGTSAQRVLEAAQDVRRSVQEETRAVGTQAQAVSNPKFDRTPSWFQLDTLAPGVSNGGLVLGAAVLGGLVLLMSMKK